MKEIPIYMVFVLYLIISSNFLAQLFSCRLQELLNSSMFVKHLIGYMTLLFFVVLSSEEGHSVSHSLLSSLLIYFIFWISTRISFGCFVVFILLTASLYIINLYQKNSNEKRNKRLETTKEVIYWLGLAVLIVGFVLYWVEKKIEYTNKFSFTTFILGKPMCKHKSPKVSRNKLLRFLNLKKSSVSPKK
jgi:hypothetical protein